MWTNEFDWEETVTTLLDDDGVQEDVQIIIDDNEVFIRQWSEHFQRYDLIVMGHDMFREFQESLKYPEGTFITEKK